MRLVQAAAVILVLAFITGVALAHWPPAIEPGGIHLPANSKWTLYTESGIFGTKPFHRKTVQIDSDGKMWLGTAGLEPYAQDEGHADTHWYADGSPPHYWGVVFQFFALPSPPALPGMVGWIAYDISGDGVVQVASGFAMYQP